MKATAPVGAGSGNDAWVSKLELFSCTGAKRETDERDVHFLGRGLGVYAFLDCVPFGAGSTGRASVAFELETFTLPSASRPRGERRKMTNKFSIASREGGRLTRTSAQTTVTR